VFKATDFISFDSGNFFANSGRAFTPEYAENTEIAIYLMRACIFLKSNKRTGNQQLNRTSAFSGLAD
jgi:hypothetical protein